MRRVIAPIWLMGLTNSVFGMYGGIIIISVPQLLSAHHVPESTIAGMTALMLSSSFWNFLISPVLDVRFSRRWYALVTALMGSGLLMLALANFDDLRIVEPLLVLGFLFANLYQSALGGWLANIIRTEDARRLSVWVTIGNVGGGGAMGIAAGEVVRLFPPTAAALILGVIIVLPVSIFAFMPAPGPDRRLARDSFTQFFGEVLGLLRRRNVLIALALFAAPAATFSLTNFLAGLGGDYHAATEFVGRVGGAGVMTGAIVGCLAFRLIDRLLPLRFLYLAIGASGALFTLLLMALPRTPASFAVSFIGENVFQSLAITASTAVAFETVGRNNPLSATTYCLMLSAFNLPITYMLFIDRAGYAGGGVSGSYAADAGVSLAACALLAGFLLWRARAQPAVLLAKAD